MPHPPLHMYQQNAIDFCRSTKRTYLAMDVGLGKTVVALKTIEDSPLKTLIVAPLRVALLTWPTEIEKWTNLSYIVLHGKNKNHNLRRRRQLYIVNYEGLKWLLSELVKSTVPRMNIIIDEASMVKNHKGVRFKVLCHMLPMFNQYRLALSATPAPNGLHELWSQYYLLNEGRSLGTKVGPYQRKYFNYDPNKHKYFITKGSREAIYKRIRPITYRLDAADYLRMPPLIYNKVQLKMPSALRRQYDTFEREFGTEEVEAFNAASLGSHLRQLVQGALYTEHPKYEVVHRLKVKTLRELMDSANEQPILCAIQFRFEYDLITEELGRKIPIIYGGTPKKDTKRYLEQWIRGELPLLLAHPASMSHGLNLQTGGRLIVWLGLPWSLDQFHQFNGRLHRQGQKHGVIVNAVMFEDSIDEVVWSVLKRKNATMQHLLTALKTRSRRHVS